MEKETKKREAEKCDECEGPLKEFVHSCSESPVITETFGCPKHDDVCGHCHDEFF